MNKIAALQFPALSLSESGFDYYLKAMKEGGVNLVVLGKYVLNNFFGELLTMSKSVIKEQNEIRKESLENLVKKHESEIIAPFVSAETRGFRKVCPKIFLSMVKNYEQQILMPYTYWDEVKFFLNKTDKIKLFSFTYKELKCASPFGFEAHLGLSW